jgi:hypothetical protein
VSFKRTPVPNGAVREDNSDKSHNRAVLDIAKERSGKSIVRFAEVLADQK